MSSSLPPHGLQHSRLPCPSTTPGTCSNSCPLSQWYHPTISFSVFPFSSHLQSFSASGSFQMSQFFSTEPCLWSKSHIRICSGQFSHLVMSDSLPPCGLQHARLFCPSITPGTFSNSCPLSQWYHPTTLSSVIPFSSCLQSFPASGSFPMSHFFTSGDQSIRVLEFQLQHQSFQWIFRTDFL